IFFVSEKIDLFGNPVRPGRGCRGRPVYERTLEDANKVKMLLALEWEQQRIANALDISLACLKKYFKAELKVRDEMRDRLDANRMAKLMAQANDGNVSALKALDQILEKQDQAKIAAALRRSQGAVKAQPKGKKEQRLVDAKTPDGQWDFLPHMKKTPETKSH
ncbi:MAG: hypothetical protein ACPG4X_18715, partial [Pikeienuella sp.]